MKKIIFTALLAFSLLSLAACGGGDSEVVVKTDAGDVTKDEFYEELKTKYGDEVLTELVTMTVLADKYEVSDEEIDAEIDSIKEQVGDDFEQTLAAQNLTEEDLRTDIENGLLQEAAMTEDIEVSDEEIKNHFDRLGYQIEAQHILLTDEDLAKEVAKKAQDGDDFAKLAEKYSTDEENAKEGGELPAFGAGEMTPEFEDAAFDMKEDEISDPIESDFGFHIIKLNKKEKTDEDIGKLEDQEDQIRRDIAATKIDQTQAMEKISKMMEDAGIDVKDKEFEGLFDAPEAPEAPEAPAE